METPPVAHPSDYILEAFDAGKLDDAGGQAVRAHLEVCPACRTRQQLRAGQPVEATAANAVGPGDTRGGNAAPEANEVAGSVPTTLFNVPPELADHPDYELLGELGRGGMGVVYLAKHRLSGRREVLKVMSKALIGQAESKERFLREIQSAARLDHKNVVKMYTALERGELMVLVMEYVPGEDLAQVVKSSGALPVSNACYYVQQAASGLQHAFEKGMIHRDIKPQNLILARQGKKHTVKVLDFGLAKATRGEDMDTGLTGTGVLMGTPGYVAPEQSLDAAAADIRADIYSLGCTLYQLLAGNPPFSGKSMFEIVQAHHATEARPLKLVRAEVPEALASVVGKMMAKNAAQRYQTPMEVVRDLEPFVKGALKPLTPQTAPPQGGQPDAAPPVIQATRIEGPATIARGRMKPSPRKSAPPKGEQRDAARAALLRQETILAGRAPSAGATTEPRRSAAPPLWVYLVFALYLLMLLLVVIGPVVLCALLFALSSGKEGLGEMLSVLFLAAVFLALGASLLLIPIGHQWNIPRAKRSIVIPCVGSATCAALLFIGGWMAFVEYAFDGPGANKEAGDTASSVFCVATFLIWILWGVVFGIMAVSVNRLTVSDRMYKTLLLGSVLELLIAIPLHLVVRRRAQCCAGAMTGFGIGMGITIMLIALGPAVFFLFFRRYRQAYAVRRSGKRS